jgi:hypothetical protein
MSLTAGDLITDAKLLAAPYVREDVASPGPLLRVLTGLDFDIVRQVALYAPELLSVQATEVPVVVASNTTGYTMTAAFAYSAFSYVKEDGERIPISIVPERRAPTTIRHPAGSIVGGASPKFFPADPFGKGWEGSDTRAWFSNTNESFVYRYVAQPARLTTLTGATGTLVAPDEARDFLQWMLCASVLEMSEAPRERMLSARDLATLARQEFIRNLVKRTGRRAAFGEPLAQAPVSTSAWIVTS